MTRTAGSPASSEYDDHALAQRHPVNDAAPAAGPGSPPAVIATDLDGTLLRSDGTISARTVAALDRAWAAGIATIFVTARPPRWLDALGHAVGEHGIAICGNGAFVYDVAARRVLRAHTFAADALAGLVADLRAGVPGIKLAAERVGGLWVEPGWPDPHREVDVAGRVVAPLDALAASPAPGDAVGKLLALAADRHTDRESFFAAVTGVVGERAVLAYSGVFDLAELGPPGVSKAAGLADWCARRGIGPDRVWAFGDMPNDVPMLRWAGRSFVVAGGHPQARAAATDECPGNDEDGVAAIIESLL